MLDLCASCMFIYIYRSNFRWLLFTLLYYYIWERTDIGELNYYTYIRAAGFRCRFPQLRDVIHELNPGGPQFRKRKVLKRMIYGGFGMQGFNFVTHIDSWHKMIRYGFVVSLMIDGYSRMIFSVQISSNNTAHSTLQAFLKGVREYGLPDRTYSDHGGENRYIASLMLQCRGLARRSHMCGDSRRNTRVERHHYEIRTKVMKPFMQLFEHFEHELHIDFTDYREKWCLHFMFLNRMQFELGIRKLNY